MKLVLALVAFLGLAVSPAFAQKPPVLEKSQVQSQRSKPSCDDLSSLSGTRFVCVRNNSGRSFIRFRASPVNGDRYDWSGINLMEQTGNLPSGQQTLVNFANYAGKCMMNIQITTDDLTTHVFKNVNICNRQLLPVNNWID